MSKINDAVFVGASGISYRFEAYTVDTDFAEVGAVYIFTKRAFQGSPRLHELIYIGQSEALRTRIEGHEKWTCVNRHLCNCICVLVVSAAGRRLEIETDLRNAFKTPCNDQ